MHLLMLDASRWTNLQHLRSPVSDRFHLVSVDENAYMNDSIQILCMWDEKPEDVLYKLSDKPLPACF